MNNLFFEDYYKKHILPMYNSLNNEKTYVIYENNEKHDYIINNRIDLTHLNVYVIDPDGCQDPDDGFSIYYEEDKLYLAIHIADPTEFIDIRSSLFQNILEKSSTQYPSNYEPIHLMPHEIVYKACLSENKYGSVKNALTIITEIDDSNYLPKGEMNLYFSIIKLSKQFSFNYSQASLIIQDDIILQNGIQIGKALFERRSITTIGAKINNYLKSKIIYKNDNLCILYQETQQEKYLKDMIAEFAILSNSFIGCYLNYHLHDQGIFRVCNEPKLNNNSINHYDMLQSLINQGIKASYVIEAKPHELIGTSLYCHMTSPIRRAPDCICHYLLKYIYYNKYIFIQKELPWTQEKLCELAEHFTKVFRQNKKIQFIDDKLRYIQVIYNLLHVNKINVELEFSIVNYSGMFINLMIQKINEHCIYFTYRVKIKNINFNKNNKKYIISITYTNLFDNIDIESLPELDNYVKSLFLHQ